MNCQMRMRLRNFTDTVPSNTASKIIVKDNSIHYTTWESPLIIIIARFESLVSECYAKNQT